MIDVVIITILRVWDISLEGHVIPLFFFQAEVGIREGHVTVVQTCALPIYSARTFSLAATTKTTPPAAAEKELNKWRQAMQDPTHSKRYAERWERLEAAGNDIDGEAREIGRASCRERVRVSE